MDGLNTERDKQLNKYHSYRIEVENDETIEIRLKTGRAEIFGAEMIPYTTYKFTGTRLAIFTWHSCSFTIKGKTLEEYEWDEGRDSSISFLAFTNIHTYLNQQRELALLNEVIGPRVLVTGANSSGKTTLCKTLVNYAVKTGWKPVYCDLDVSYNDTFTQGTIGSSVIETYFPDNFFEHKSLVYFYGSPEIDKVKFYQEQVKRLGEAVKAKLEEDLRIAKSELLNPNLDGGTDKDIGIYQEKMTCFSGVIVNMGPWPAGMNLELKKETIATIINTFNIDTTIVIDDQALIRTVEEIDEKRGMAIEFMQKIGGVTDQKNKEDRAFKKFYEYFYGVSYDIMRQSVDLDFEKFRLYEVATFSDDVPPALIPVKIDCRKLKKKKIVGVLNLIKSENEEPTLDEIMSASLAYLIYVNDVDLEKGKVKLDFPGPSDVKWALQICIDSKIFKNLK